VNDGKIYLLTKRSIDVIGSLFEIIMLSFLFMIISILIKVEDPKGSIFFYQKRVCLNGKQEPGASALRFQK
jgi:lipopolysaccharide/colanic/teichoic acid biosynthesis glycosyltransferase